MTHTTTTCNNTECWVLSTILSAMLSTEYWVQYWVGCREVGTLPTKRQRQDRAPSAWAPSAWAAKDKCDFYIHHLLQSPAMMACDVAIDRSPIIEIQLWKVCDCRGFYFQINAGFPRHRIFAIEDSQQIFRPGNDRSDAGWILHLLAQNWLWGLQSPKRPFLAVLVLLYPLIFLSVT